MIERLKSIFAGLESAYGATKITNEIRHDGKNEVRSYTVKKPVTNQLWENHLKGTEPALGIVPINENNECKWGCIDIDTYPFDHKSLIKKIRKNKYPLIVFRSKSGGAHVFLFTESFIPASLMRQKLQLMASSLGYAKAEIFPKQSTIKADRGDIGNFLNMPYHGGDRTVRYAIGDDGNSLTIEKFIEEYDKYVQTEEQLKKLLIVKEEKKKKKEPFPDGPPCLNTIISNGPIVEGNGDIAHSGRDNGLFNIGVYYKKADPMGWSKKVDDANHSFLKPPLGPEDVIRIKEQVEKKDYDYKCKDKPICNFCNEKICYTKKYGKGDEVRMPEITTIRKYDSDPPIFFVTVDEETVEVDAATLHDHEKFSVVCMSELGTPLLPEAKLIWRKKLAKLMKNMDDPIEAPDDTKYSVQLKEALIEFIGRKGKDISDIEKRKPYTENGISYFKLKDFWAFLIKSKSWDKKKNATMRMMQNLFNAEQDTVEINGKTVRVIAVPNIEIEKPIIRQTRRKPAPFE